MPLGASHKRLAYLKLILEIELTTFGIPEETGDALFSK
jgi:hypothetical protein